MPPPSDRALPPPALRRAGQAWRRLRARRPGLPIALAAAALWMLGAWHVAVVPFPLLTRLELAFADLRQSLALPPVAAPRDDIVIVDVDDASLRALGRWPWPRDRLAHLVDRLFEDDHVAALGMDLVLAEPDDESRVVGDALRGLERLGAGDPALRTGVARWRPALERAADHDTRLAQAIAHRPVTLAYHFTDGDDPLAAAPGPRGDLPGPITESGVLPASALAMTPWRSIVVPVPALARAAGALGFINELADADGQLRSTPLAAAYRGAVYESFGVALWSQWHHVSVVRPVLARGAVGGPPRLTGLQLIDAAGEPVRRLRVDERGAVTLPYRRAVDPGNSPGSGRFRYIPAADVLSGRAGPPELAGRVVLLGSSAPGLADVRATPVSRVLPGVEVHAQLLAGLEDGDLSVHPTGRPASSSCCWRACSPPSPRRCGGSPGPRP